MIKNLSTETEGGLALTGMMWGGIASATEAGAAETMIRAAGFTVFAGSIVVGLHAIYRHLQESQE